MTKVQKLQLRAAEIEKRLEAINALPKAEQSSEIKAEADSLLGEQMTMGSKLAAAILEQDQGAHLVGDQAHADGAFAEMAHVAAQASVGEFFHNLYEKTPHTGALAEIQAHYGMGRNDIPLDLLRGAGGGGIRAAATPAPENVGRTEQPVVQPVFAMGDAAFLSIDMPTVEAGDATFPVLTTRPAVGGPHKDSAVVAETDGVFGAEVLQPERIQAAFSYRRTDATRFMGMDMALRQALTMGLSEKIDSEVVAQLVADVGRGAAAAADSFASYRKRLVYDQIDGRFAMGEGDMRLLMGSGTLSHASGEYRANTADDSAVDSLRRISGGLRVSAHIAAVVGNKQDVIVRRGMRRDMVCPLWRNVTIIFDEVTKAGSGEIVLTAVLQFAKAVIRADGFARVEAQHA